MKPIIRVENLGKQYRLGGPQEAYSTLRESLANAARPWRWRKREKDAPEIWALREVNFTVTAGEVVGVIGRNGAGKSTLLKVLSRITEPTQGRVELYGRVGSLLEVGTGFHPELTGRENIYLNGAILGMKRQEIVRVFDNIVAFAEVEQFIDTPVKRYSSGMYLRLAFAVAAHLEPEILFVDEVLAVGDVAFQKKCLGLMSDVANAGRTVLLVSHQMGAIESLCPRVLLFEQGRLAYSGDTRAGIDRYLAAMRVESDGDLANRTDRQGEGRLRFTKFAMRKPAGETVAIAQCGQDLEFVLNYERDAKPLSNVALWIGVSTLSGQYMLMLGNDLLGANLDGMPQQGALRCLIPRFPLTPGRYSIALFCTVNGVIADWLQNATEITVEAGDFYGTGRLPPPSTGGVLIGQQWRFTD